MSLPLSVTNLCKVYKGKQPFVAVDNVSFKLHQGEVLGLLGPNGSGKTTTIQMLLGTLTYTSGQISYFGRDFVKNQSWALQFLSFASTYNNLPGDLTVEEALNVFGYFYGHNKKESKKRYRPLLERFGINEKAKKPIRTLSAGQMTRLVLVKAFFIEPKILLLDEPTASLDPDVSKEVCDFILQERDRTGLSILFTSHKMEEATELCDRVIFLKKGKIIADDTPTNLAKSISTFTLKLLVSDGLKRLLSYLEARQMHYQLDHRLVEVSIDEKEIPAFLNHLVRSEISYANIRIEEPSLDDYFLQIAGRK